MKLWDMLFNAKPPSEERALNEGRQSKTLWENEAFQRAVMKVRVGIHEKWAQAPIIDRDGHHELRLMLKLLDDIEGNIRKEIGDAVIAQKIIEDRNKQEERKRNIAQLRR